MAKKNKKENENDEIQAAEILHESAEDTELGSLDVPVLEEDGFLAALEESEEKYPVEETAAEDLSDSELGEFETAEIIESEFIEDQQLESIVESILFASDRPVSLNSLKAVFKGTNIANERIKRTLEQLAVEYAGARRGVTLEEVPGGFQLRTKVDNLNFLKRTLKARSFRLSGPALEVLSIVAYKQPLIKNEIDQIRGVESGHLLRALMEKGLVCFEGKSELPGRPMQYGTTKKFLEIFSLRNLRELPSLSQIDELIPEGIGEETQEKAKLSDITSTLSQSVGSTYSEGEEDLLKIQEQLETISTSTEFFEEEKRRAKEEKERAKAESSGVV